MAARRCCYMFCIVINLLHGAHFICVVTCAAAPWIYHASYNLCHCRSPTVQSAAQLGAPLSQSLRFQARLSPAQMLREHGGTICIQIRFPAEAEWISGLVTLCVWHMLCNNIVGLVFIDPGISLPPGERFDLQAAAQLGLLFAALEKEEGKHCCLATGGIELSVSHKTGC